MRRFTAAAALAMTSCLASCGSSVDPEAVVVRDAPDASEPVPHEGDEPTATTGSDALADLHRSTLTAGDLPLGWAEADRDEVSGDGVGGVDCSGETGDGELDGLEASVRVIFRDGPTFPMLEQHLSSFETPSQALAALDESATRLEECAEIAIEDGGVTVTGQISVKEFPAVVGSDGQSGVEVEIDVGGRRATSGMILLAEGSHLTTIAYSDLGDYDPAFLVDAANVAADRL